MLRGSSRLKKLYSSQRQVRFVPGQYSKAKLPSGTTLHHFDTTDPNKCMGVFFRTLPGNDRGVPHVLEHLATTGSKDYPVRDPFMRMNRRVVSTYMNAWTSCDFTGYPFSSNEPQSFQHLAKLYLSLAFNPSLTREDFLQEGVRVEADAQGQLKYNGVVFNQMVGTYQSPEAYFQRQRSRHLYRGSELGLDYGGDPGSLRQLTYEQLLQFYSKYYVPANCHVFYYGCQAQRIVDLLNQKTSLLNSGAGAKEPRAPTPQRFINVAPPLADSPDILAVNLLQEQPLKNIPPVDLVKLQILGEALLKFKSSPFYKLAMNQLKLACFTQTSGFNRLFYPNFSIGVQGKIKSADQLERRLLGLLSDVTEQGLNPQLVQMASNRFSLRHHSPRQNAGIALLENFASEALSGVDLHAYFEAIDNYEQIGKSLLDPTQQKRILRQYLDPGRVCSVSQLSTTSAQVRDYSNVLGTVDLQSVQADAKALASHQGKVQDQSVLPFVDCRSLQFKEKQMKQLESRQVRGVQTSFVATSTDVVTLRLVFRLKELPLFVRPFLGVMERLINFGVDTKGTSSEQLVAQFQQFGTMPKLSYQRLKAGSEHDCFVLRTQFLESNASKVVPLLTEFLLQPAIQDLANLSNFIKSEKTSQLNLLAESPQVLLGEFAGSFLNQGYFIKDGLRGARFLLNVHDGAIGGGLLRYYAQSLQFTLASFVKILLRKQNLSTIIHCRSSKVAQFQKLLEHSFQSFESQPQYGIPNEPVFNQQHTNPFMSRSDVQLNVLYNDNSTSSCCQAVKMPFWGREDGKALLLSQLLNEPLHNSIRQEGGAYGAWSSIRRNILFLHSYMDNNPERTVGQFQRILDSTLSRVPSHQELQKAKLAVLNGLYRPIKPYDNFLQQIIEGREPNHLRRLAQQVKDETGQGLAKWMQHLGKESCCAVFGGKQVFKNTVKFEQLLDVKL